MGTRSADLMSAAGGRFRRKSESLLCKIIGFLAILVGMKEFWWRSWTTIGRTVYIPDNVINPLDGQWVHMIEHEVVHIMQQRRWGPWFWLTYMVSPLPVFFCYGRFYWERYAYLKNIQSGIMTPLQAAETLDKYGRPWPKTWMFQWFKKKSIR